MLKVTMLQGLVSLFRKLCLEPKHGKNAALGPELTNLNLASNTLKEKQNDPQKNQKHE